MPTGLDTNILIYALAGQDEEKRRVAEGILRDAIENPQEYIISAQALAETIYVVARKAPELLEEARRLVDLLSATLKVASYTTVEVLLASQGPARHFWDRLLAYTYLRHGADKIITEDEKPYKNIIQATNPFREPQE